MAAAFQRFAGKALSGSLWHAAPMVVQVAAGIAACLLWTGVASPGLKLLPGLERGLATRAPRSRCRARCSGSTTAATAPPRSAPRDAAAVLAHLRREPALADGRSRRRRGPRARHGGAMLVRSVTSSPVSSPPQSPRGTRLPPLRPAHRATRRRRRAAPQAPPPTAAPSAPKRPSARGAPTAPTFPAAPPLAPPVALLTQTVEFNTTAPASAVVGGTTSSRRAPAPVCR